MPYTPPSHRSPASSTTSSPEASRRPSLATAGSRPSLPRSASYLTRHRRTPSAPATLQNVAPKSQPTPEGTSEDLKSMVSGASVRKSPPPVTDGLGIPNGAILSPPESSASSDDDDLPEVRGRKIENLKELQEAISQIPQHREGSPTKDGAAAPLKVVIDSPKAGEILHTSFSTGTLDALAGAARRMSHQRSATESDIVIPKVDENSISASDVDSDEETMRRKPQMVRKKSGELVRPALRPPSRRRPSSMPGTPTFSKAVHFDSHLEHVRHFLQVDRPLAVSAGSSPNDNYGSDNEFPFPGTEGRPQPRSPPYEWELIVTNFPLETPDRKAMPVRLERVWLTADQKSLVGSVDVANLAFQKQVTCRFTFDYWKTTSEVAAEYSTEIRTHTSHLPHDRFTFSIKLSEMANLESKTLYFCIRYNVNGQELWDSNGGTNFQVDFHKKMLPQNGKRGFQGASARPASSGGLPKSNRRGGHPPEASKPKPAPSGMSEFGQNGKIKFDQSIEDYLGDEGSASIRLKGVKSTTSIASDNLPSRLSTPSGQAFANRYDFGASLSTAIQAAKQSSPKSEDLYMKGSPRGAPRQASRPALPHVNTGPNPALATRSSQATKKPAPTMQPAAPFPGAHGVTGSSLASASYEELVNKYCFFGSKQSSPQMNDGTPRSTGRFDGADDGSSSNDSSLMGTPVQMPSHGRPQGYGAQHHSLRNVHPYFNTVSGFPVPSPVPSPPQQPPQSQARSSPIPANTGRSTSPATGMVGSFHPMTGTSSSNELQYHQHNYGRFPFAETHAAPAIRG